MKGSVTCCILACALVGAAAHGSALAEGGDGAYIDIEVIPRAYDTRRNIMRNRIGETCGLNFQVMREEYGEAWIWRATRRDGSALDAEAAVACVDGDYLVTSARARPEP